AWIGRAAKLGRPDEKRERCDRHHHYKGSDRVAPRDVGPKWDPALREQLVILCTIGLGVDHLSAYWWCRNAVVQNQIKMEGDYDQDEGSQEEDVERKKPAKRGASKGFAAEQKAREVFP